MLRVSSRLSSQTFLNTKASSLLGIRAYSIKTKAKHINNVINRIGDENTQESKKTIKVVRMVGAGSIIIVLCSLFWASSLSAPVKDAPVELSDLKKDVRD